jgi:hypothetical protein
VSNAAKNKFQVLAESSEESRLFEVPSIVFSDCASQDGNSIEDFENIKDDLTPKHKQQIS